MKKVCIHCSDFVRGRSDKKFCSDQCRSSFHNKVNYDSNRFIRNINRIIKMNRNLLVKLKGLSERRLTKSQLMAKGFAFDYFTHEVLNEKGQIIRYCYDLGYFENRKGLIEIELEEKEFENNQLNYLN